jgi:hypothetical protein
LSDLLGKVDRKARKPCITQEMINKKEELRGGRKSTTKKEGNTTED